MVSRFNCWRYGFAVLRRSKTVEYIFVSPAGSDALSVEMHARTPNDVGVCAPEVLAFLDLDVSVDASLCEVLGRISTVTEMGVMMLRSRWESCKCGTFAIRTDVCYVNCVSLT